jgi:hypothetical protein
MPESDPVMARARRYWQAFVVPREPNGRIQRPSQRGGLAAINRKQVKEIDARFGKQNAPAASAKSAR